MLSTSPLYRPNIQYQYTIQTKYSQHTKVSFIDKLAFSLLTIQEYSLHYL